MVMWAEGKASFSGSICRQALQRPADSIHQGLKSSSMLSRFSPVWLFGTPWTVTHQAPLCMGFLRPEYWSGLPFPSPGDRPDPGIEPRSPTLEAGALPSEPPGNPCVKWTVSPSVVSDSAIPWTAWNSPGQNTGMGSLSLFQEIFPTQGSNPGLPHCRWILY